MTVSDRTKQLYQFEPDFDPERVGAPEEVQPSRLQLDVSEGLVYVCTLAYCNVRL